MVQPVVLSPEGGPARVRVQSSSAYDGFGLSVAQKSAEGAFDVSDPVSFGGQFGCDMDVETGLLCLTQLMAANVTLATSLGAIHTRA